MARLALLVLVALAATAALASPAAAPGMRVGAEVCFEAIALECVGRCVELPLSPPDLCPQVTLPL